MMSLRRRRISRPLQVPNRSVMMACVLSSAAPAAAGPNYTPAHFGDSEKSLEKIVDCPRKAAEKAVVGVLCQTVVTTTGKPGRSGRPPNFCLGFDNGLERYVRAVETALENAEFAPATVAGDPIEVYFTFRVFFLLAENRCNVVLVPNSGEHVDSFGLGYFAPQEILIDEQSWPKRSGMLNRKSWTLDYAFTGSGNLFTISVDVDRSGHASNPEIISVRRGLGRLAERAVKSFEASRFVPGFVDGRPTPMTAFEFFLIGRRVGE